MGLGADVRQQEMTMYRPDNTAVRTALWRALHLIVDEPPYVFEDDIGLKLVAPDEEWRKRPDMSPFTKPFRAAIVARSRFIEDLVEERVLGDVSQYVLLGAGLDSFAQRRGDLASKLQIFELDQSEPQEWKRAQLVTHGYGIAENLNLVPVNFEAGDNWMERVVAAGFEMNKPAVVTSSGVSMYLTKEAIMATLKQVATLASGSTFVMSFLCPLDMLDPDVRVGVERAAEGARANGTPWISFFRPEEIVALALEAGFNKVEHISAAELGERYFSERTDGLRPPKNSEELLVATI